MFSHGSSARVGVGKRGHGGRNYRPPPKRDPSKLVPPPLKHCNCMIQLDIPEYAREANAESTTPNGSGEESSSSSSSSSPGGDRRRRRQAPQQQQQQQQQLQQPPRRLHLCFEGSSLDERQKSVRRVETELRSRFAVHLVIPGRNQKGPLAVAGKSYRETIPAVAHLLNQLILEVPNNNRSGSEDDTLFSASPGSSSSLTGRILRNVKDPNDNVLSGRFRQQRKLRHRLSPLIASAADDDNDDRAVITLDPNWLFESDQWKIMVCPLAPPPSLSMQQEKKQDLQQPQRYQTAIAEALKTSIDNLRFRLGNNAFSNLEIFLHQPQALPNSRPEPPGADKRTDTNMDVPTVFVAGDPSSQSGTVISALYEEVRQIRVELPDAGT